MGFLNFLNKGKKEVRKEDSLEIPPPPSMSEFSDLTELPSLADEKEHEMLLPPLEPLEILDKKYLEIPLADDKRGSNAKNPFDFPQPSAKPQVNPPIPKPAFLVEKPELFSPFKEKQIPTALFPESKFLPQGTLFPSSKKQKFVRVEKFRIIAKHIEDIKTAAELNRSVTAVKKIKTSYDKEFEVFHRALEEMQRNLVLVDQTIFEEGG